MGCSASQPQEYEVELSVYTLGQKGSIAERAGAYHTGLVVDGVEWAFGGGDGPGTGVWSQEPGRLPPSFSNCAFKVLVVLFLWHSFVASVSSLLSPCLFSNHSSCRFEGNNQSRAFEAAHTGPAALADPAARSGMAAAELQLGDTEL